jgi:hypothetical protein
MSGMSSNREIVKMRGFAPGALSVERAQVLLAHAITTDEVKEIRDRAIALAVYYRKIGAGKKAEIDAQEIVADATLRYGELRLQNPPKLGHPFNGSNTEPLDKKLSSLSQKLAKMPREIYEAKKAACRQRGRISVPLLFSTSAAGDYDGDEWRTPKETIDRVCEVLGQIDLDPASSDGANATVQAKRFYTKKDDGLERRWSGRVFLNPPYSYPLVEQFTDKFIALGNA